MKENRKLNSHSKSNLLGSVRENKNSNLRIATNPKLYQLTPQGFQDSITTICQSHHSTEQFIIFNIWFSTKSNKQLKISSPLKRKARAHILTTTLSQKLDLTARPQSRFQPDSQRDQQQEYGLDCKALSDLQRTYSL